MSKRVIVVFPRVPPDHPLLALRHRFDPLAGRVPPHLTLVFPFESALTPAALQAHAGEAVRGIAPFPVRLAGVTGSEGAYLFLNVKRGNDQLIEVHDRLYTGPLRPFLAPDHTYLPHLTVGRLADPEAFREALARAVEMEVRLDTCVRELAVYRVESAASRPVESTVPLR